MKKTIITLNEYVAKVEMANKLNADIPKID